MKVNGDEFTRWISYHRYQLIMKYVKYSKCIMYILKRFGIGMKSHFFGIPKCDFIPKRLMIYMIWNMNVQNINIMLRIYK